MDEEISANICQNIGVYSINIKKNRGWTSFPHLESYQRSRLWNETKNALKRALIKEKIDILKASFWSRERIKISSYL